MDWWEQPYPGGPMVAVPGFPRPLYWPGNEDGYDASVDGPDVVAYKRTVSRAGRWPWQPFDDTFSKGFACGTSGNVGDTGVAGVQRQGGIPPGTGYIGKDTFNLLRSIRIPEGLPHAGDPAMDVTAQNLIAEAFRIFSGEEPDGKIRAKALRAAQNEIGYTESPRGSNQTKFGKWYGMDEQPWCAMLMTWCYEPLGSSSFVRGSRYAYCPYIFNDARAHRYGLSLTSNPIPGDLVLYDFDGSLYDHVGIFESGSANSWVAVEGNTSSGTSGSQSNGGGVFRRKRSRSDVVKVAFVRVAA